MGQLVMTRFFMTHKCINRKINLEKWTSDKIWAQDWCDVQSVVPAGQAPRWKILSLFLFEAGCYCCCCRCCCYDSTLNYNGEEDRERPPNTRLAKTGLTYKRTHRETDRLGPHVLLLYCLYFGSQTNLLLLLQTGPTTKARTITPSKEGENALNIRAFALSIMCFNFCLWTRKIHLY